MNNGIISANALAKLDDWRRKHSINNNMVYALLRLDTADNNQLYFDEIKHSLSSRSDNVGNALGRQHEKWINKSRVHKEGCTHPRTKLRMTRQALVAVGELKRIITITE